MYDLRFTDTAIASRSEIKDRRKQKQIKKQFERLRHAPKKIGKPLVDDLRGFIR